MVKFTGFFRRQYGASTRLPDLSSRQVAAHLTQRAAAAVPRGTHKRFVREGNKWILSPPLNYSAENTLPAGMMLVSRKEYSKLKEQATQGASSSSLGSASEVYGQASQHPSIASLFKARSGLKYPFAAKSAFVEGFVQNPAMSQRKYQETVVTTVGSFLDTAEESGSYLLDSRTTASAVQTLLALEPGQLKNIQQAMDQICKAPPAPPQALEIEAARLDCRDATVASVAPTKPSLTTWTVEVGQISDYMRHEDATRINACIVADADSGTSGAKVLHVGATIWDPVSRRVSFEYLCGFPSGGTAEENAATLEQGMLKRNISGRGSTADSAGDMASALAAKMREKHPEWYQAGCLLHVFSKGSECGFDAAFGKATADVPGSQRLLFIVHYLIVHNKESFIRFCVRVLGMDRSEVFIPALGEKGRWWSMYQAAGDIRRQFDLYFQYFLWKSNDKTETSTFRKLYETAAKWMKNEVIIAEVTFILCFHSSFWAKHFQWFLDMPDWMDQPDMPLVNKIGGCRAPQVVRKLILIVRELDSLKGSMEGTPLFHPWKAKIDALGPQQKALELQKGEIVVDTFIEVIERMAGGWLVEKVDSALLDDLVGLHVAKKLLSVYHTGTGRFAYAPPDAAETVDIDGVAVPLAELVEDMTQLIDGEEGAAQLRAQSLFLWTQRT